MHKDIDSSYSRPQVIVYMTNVPLAFFCICLIKVIHNEEPHRQVNVRQTFLFKGTSRQRSGKGAIRKRFPLQKPRWKKIQTNNQVLIP